MAAQIKAVQQDGLIIPDGLNVGTARLPAVYESAKLALAECSRIDECKDWANKAEALASYARQADDDTLRKTADRIQARAIRRCGELLKEIKPSNGGRPKKEKDDPLCKEQDHPFCLDCGAVFSKYIDDDLLPIWHCPECDHHHGQDRSICNNCHIGKRPKLRRAPTLVSRKQAARDAGLSENQQKTALRVASVPAKEFEKAVESDTPPTVTQLAEQGKKSKPKPLVDLGGRDPEEFAASTKGQGAIGRLFEVADSIPPTVIARGALKHEQPTLKKRVRVLITWLTSLEEEL